MKANDDIVPSAEERQPLSLLTGKILKVVDNTPCNLATSALFSALLNVLTQNLHDGDLIAAANDIAEQAKATMKNEKAIRRAAAQNWN